LPELPDDKKATEHLANERTFLAWVRTSIAIVSLGFVVAKFGIWLRELGARLSPATPLHGAGLSGPIGIAMIAVGGLLALAAAWRFHVVNRQIDQGRVRVDRGMVWTVAVVMAAVAAVMVVYLTAST
jgi:putative membrane protein